MLQNGLIDSLTLVQKAHFQAGIDDSKNFYILIFSPIREKIQEDFLCVGVGLIESAHMKS